MEILYTILYIVGILASTYLSHYAISKVLDFAYNKIAKRTTTKFDDEMIPLLKRVIGIAVWLYGLSQIFMYFGLDLRTVSSVIGVGGFLSVLAVKDAIADVIAGINIMIDKPFRVGDKIRLSSGHLGEVVTIGLRRTYIKIRDGNRKAILIHTNKKLKDMMIINFNYGKEYNENSRNKRR